MKKLFLFLSGLAIALSGFSQTDANTLLEKIKTKYNQVKDYEATGKMKTNVIFIKAPLADIRVFYKNPDKIKIKNESGVSFVPKGSVNINMGNIFTLANYTAIDAGTETLNGKKVRLVKVLPDGESGEIVLSTLYIDEAAMLVVKSKTTTRENGTYELDMSYGKYASYGLPDKVKFTFNTKEYKLPKGVTFDYDNGSSEKEKEATANKKGTVEITYTSYSINKGLKDEVFK